MYKTVRDSVNSDLVKRSRSQIKVKRFGFSGAVFIYLDFITAIDILPLKRGYLHTDSAAVKAQTS